MLRYVQLGMLQTVRLLVYRRTFSIYSAYVIFSNVKGGAFVWTDGEISRFEFLIVHHLSHYDMFTM